MSGKEPENSAILSVCIQGNKAPTFGFYKQDGTKFTNILIKNQLCFKEFGNRELEKMSKKLHFNFCEPSKF